MERNKNVKRDRNTEHKPVPKMISRGIKAKISPLVYNEVWNVWEANADFSHDNVEVVKMEKCIWLFCGAFQRARFTQLNKTVTFRTNNATIMDLVITYFDGEATMLLYSEAKEIFGDNLRAFE